MVSWVKPMRVRPTLSTAASPFGGFRLGGDRKPPSYYIITVMLSQLNKDIDYCTRVLGCNAEQTDELIGAAEALTVNAEYFCEEFIVAPEGENAMKYQREDFIDLDAFNALHGIYFEEVD